ncbi:protein mono-ADP-ribosyltransferase PARP4-like, partial [Mus pahari]|uniref:protein mono-ADP-ribosyltransferase PARP4-like n=1 Tax=Mus pahari TaxID=10093 RepID=UPI001114CE06
PGGTHLSPLPPAGTQFSLSPIGFIPPKLGSPKLGHSRKLTGDTDIRGSEPPLLGFRDMCSGDMGFSGGTTFSGSFASSKDFDAGKFSQDPNNISFSPKAPEMDALHLSPFCGPPKPPSAPPLVTNVLCSEVPQSSIFHLQSAEVHQSPTTRVSEISMESVESARPLDSPLRAGASYFALEDAEDASLGGSSFEIETYEAAASFIADYLLTSMETSWDEECTFCDEGQKSPVPWASLFALQTEDGFWKLTPELGLILKLNVNALLTSLEEKGIRSLGTKGRERLLDLIATLLVLQFLYTELEQEGMVATSLIKMDDAIISRNIPWAFENIKKAREWARRTEGQYPSICQRLELGKDWESATKQLLGIQPQANTSLHRILHYSQG